MRYLFSKCEKIYIDHSCGCANTIGDGTEYFIIPKWAVDRWTRQMNTPYADLSEEEKESDRREGDKFLELFHAQLTALLNSYKETAPCLKCGRTTYKKTKVCPFCWLEVTDEEIMKMEEMKTSHSKEE
jgi:hypothetical protein